MLNPSSLNLPKKDPSGDGGDLTFEDDEYSFIEKRILSSATYFYLTFPEYSLPLTNAVSEAGDQNLCGNQGRAIYTGIEKPDDYDYFDDVLSLNDTTILRFTFTPTIAEHFGEFDFYLNFQVTTPANSAPYTYRTRVAVKKCFVQSIYPGYNFPQLVLQLSAEEDYQFTFDDYRFIPACNYTISYTLTVAENSHSKSY